MTWIQRKLEGIFLSRAISGLVKYLDGKKTLVGAASLLLWVCIYAVPAFTPNYSWITVLATQIRDGLLAAGIQLDNSLFNAGLGFTVVGLVDKVRKLIKENKECPKTNEKVEKLN